MKATRVMRGGTWHRWDPATANFVPETGSAGPPPQQPVELSLRHERGIDPAGQYRLQVFMPARVVGEPLEARELVIEGSHLVEWFLNPNAAHRAARFLDPAPLVPMLDTLAGSPELHWTLLDAVPQKLLDGFCLVDDRGYVVGVGRFAGSPLTARVWSAWRRKAEADAAKAKGAPPVVESEESAPTEPPKRRRTSPWRNPKAEVNRE